MDTYMFVYVTIFLVALVQIPIGVDLLRFIFPEWRLARLASRIVYSILFTVMGIIFCIGLSYHLFVYLPLLAEDPLHSVKGILHIIFALWIWTNMVANYYFAVFLHPGVDKEYTPEKPLPVRSVQLESVNSISQPQSTTLRSRVPEVDGATLTETIPPKTVLVVQEPPIPENGVAWKPRRTQYCKVCRNAIPYMDHHCPFTGNCAGLHNYSYFFIGLCYGVAGLWYAVVITFPYFYECNVKNILWYIGLIGSREISEVCSHLGPHSHIFLPVFAGLWVSTNMLILQVLFLLADISTYNTLKKWSKYPMLSFAWQRIRARKFFDSDSRLNVLIVNQRPSLLWYLVPPFRRYKLTY